MDPDIRSSPPKKNLLLCFLGRVSKKIMHIIYPNHLSTNQGSQVPASKAPGGTPFSVSAHGCQNVSTGPGEIQIDIITSSDSELRANEKLPSVLLETTPQEPSPAQQGSTIVASEESRRVALILANPIIKNMRDQELGKMVLAVSVPITTAFTIYFFYVKSPPFIVRFVVVLLSIGCTAILNGLLLRDYCPLTATLTEIVGIAIVLLAVHAIVGSFLPSGLRWIGVIIYVSTVAPFIIAATAVIVPPADLEAHGTPD